MRRCGAAPHDVALALDLSPTSQSWRDLSAAASGYGLTKGSWNASKVEVTELGRRATAPTEEGDEVQAKAEAALKPKSLAGFFEKYNKSKFPQDNIAKNVLAQEFNVPQERLDGALRIIKDNGQFAGFIRNTKTGPFVTIEDPQPRPVRLPAEPPAEIPSEAAREQDNVVGSPPTTTMSSSFKVFIAHGKNLAIVEQVNDILALYDIDFEIAAEEETAAIPVPAKVMAAMRRCQAAVMVVTADEANKSGDEYHINTNVPIEIGSAFPL